MNGPVGLASVTDAFVQPDDIPCIVSLQRRNGKSGEVRLCLNLQLGEFGYWSTVPLFFPNSDVFQSLRGCPGASRVLTTCVFGSFFLAKPFRIRMQLIEQGFEFVDVDVQDSLEELPANFLESNLQLRYNSPSPAGRLNNQ